MKGTRHPPENHLAQPVSKGSAATLARKGRVSRNRVPEVSRSSRRSPGMPLLDALASETLQIVVAVFRRWAYSPRSIGRAVAAEVARAPSAEQYCVRGS
jgi:hypothetical protein